MQILIHCASEKRKELFEEVFNIFENEDLRFKAFLGYFKKNWLDHPFLDELFEAIEKNEDLEFIRTNNPCENFHQFLGKFSQIYFINSCY